MEKISPPPCPSSVTLRRNPLRGARQTPSTIFSPSSKFPVDEILSMKVNPSDSLTVYLRVRPLPLSKSKKLQTKTCLLVRDSHSVLITPPCDSNRSKSEFYKGFTHVFSTESSQDDVYDKMMRPMVDEFLKGKSGLLSAIGPTGSGKTHTVFGSVKDPGLVPRALRHLFQLDEQNKSKLARTFYMSIFEISSEKGKGEKLNDLSPDGADIYMQQSAIKGLKEVLVSDVAQAESLLAHAKTKRATATTNSNSQSSRSQCIINIRCVLDDIHGESKSQIDGAVLTFVDLAGAEREKKTGNQGGRLLESNFINNTSMVLGLCLRSLLEHQKNPKKPLQKHFQSSLLTRYLRDYLEGRKRMALILTVRSGEEDYFDTSFLLRQASPYTEIKFHNVEETSNMPGKKRQNQNICIGQQKRVKLSNTDVCKDYVGKTNGGSTRVNKETALKEVPIENEKYQSPKRNTSSGSEATCSDANIERGYHVMCGFARALWNVLKQYKGRVKVMQSEIDVLTENLMFEHNQFTAMEKELHDLKSRFCDKQVPIVDVSSKEDHENLALEVNPTELECNEKVILDQTGEQFLHSECDVLEITAHEEIHECSTSEIQGTFLSPEKHVRHHSEGEVTKILASEVGCQRNDFQTIKAGISRSEEGSGFVGSITSAVKPKEHQGSGSVDLSKVIPGNFSANAECIESVNANSESVNANCESNVIVKNPSQRTSNPSLDFETSAQQSYQPSTSVRKILHDHGSGHECCNDLSKQDDEVSRGTPACLPQPHVGDPMVHGEISGYNTHSKEDKENASIGLRSNINLEADTKQSLDTRPSKAKRPKRRLMPASTLLLRDVSGMDISGESEMPKKGRERQRLVEDELKQTRGNASLIRLLKNHLPR